MTKVISFFIKGIPYYLFLFQLQKYGFIAKVPKISRNLYQLLCNPSHEKWRALEEAMGAFMVIYDDKQSHLRRYIVLFY